MSTLVKTPSQFSDIRAAYLIENRTNRKDDRMFLVLWRLKFDHPLTTERSIAAQEDNKNCSNCRVSRRLLYPGDYWYERSILKIMPNSTMPRYTVSSRKLMPVVAAKTA
jgi:hypothetical protein